MTRWSPSEGRGLQRKGRDPEKRRYSSFATPSATPPLLSAVARQQASTLQLWSGPANEVARHCPAVRRWAATCGARGRGLRVARGGARLVRLRRDGGGLNSPSTAAAIGPGQGRGSVSEQQVWAAGFGDSHERLRDCGMTAPVLVTLLVVRALGEGLACVEGPGVSVLSRGAG